MDLKRADQVYDVRKMRTASGRTTWYGSSLE